METALESTRKLKWRVRIGGVSEIQKRKDLVGKKGIVVGRVMLARFID